ncbi:MAG: DUF4854 domain-containing protein [Lachnospiraceae bacterium]|nr:DUF4854 domain-containing protein [Lachnospiraceae bacterium]MCM1238600.1 DUF4854 domain-containing protein [Lachnospiraceae bacterium]
MKRKLLTLALTAAMALSFAACGSKDDGSARAGSSSAAQSSAPAANSSQAEDAVMTLADWLETDEAKQAESATNSALAATGMSIKLAADGNVFIYEYTMPDSNVYNSMAADAIAALFDPVIEANKSGLADLFESFASTYDIRLEGARFVFLTADGTELYSADVANE